MTERKATKEAEMLEMAWVIIANASHGDWNRESPQWREAALQWREDYHSWLTEWLKANPPTLMPLPPEAAPHD